MLNYYVGHAEEPGLTERLYAALKALKYLFRFIVQSRVLYLRYEKHCNTRIHSAFPFHSEGDFLCFNGGVFTAGSMGTARTETLSSTPSAPSSSLSTLSWTDRWMRE